MGEIHQRFICFASVIAAKTRCGGAAISISVTTAS
jgi:hypothetical protein